MRSRRQFLMRCLLCKSQSTDLLCISIGRSKEGGVSDRPSLGPFSSVIFPWSFWQKSRWKISFHPKLRNWCTLMEDPGFGLFEFQYSRLAPNGWICMWRLNPVSSRRYHLRCITLHSTPPAQCRGQFDCLHFLSVDLEKLSTGADPGFFMGCQPIILRIFPNKCMKIKKFGSHGERPKLYYLDLPVGEYNKFN